MYKRQTEYSLLDGVGKIDDYLDRAKALGMQAIAITDHGNLFGVLELYKKAMKKGIKPVIGLEAYVSEFSMLEKDGRDVYKRQYSRRTFSNNAF